MPRGVGDSREWEGPAEKFGVKVGWKKEKKKKKAILVHQLSAALSAECRARRLFIKIDFGLSHEHKAAN